MTRSSPTLLIDKPIDSETEVIENTNVCEIGTDNNIGNTIISDENIDDTNNNNDTADNTIDNNSTETTPNNYSNQTGIPDITNNATTSTNNPPVAIATISKQRICEGERVTLDVTNSYDPDDGDSISSYRWSVEEWDDEDNSVKIITLLLLKLL